MNTPIDRQTGRRTKLNVGEQKKGLASSSAVSGWATITAPLKCQTLTPHITLSQHDRIASTVVLGGKTHTTFSARNRIEGRIALSPHLSLSALEPARVCTTTKWQNELIASMCCGEKNRVGGPTFATYDSKSTQNG